MFNIKALIILIIWIAFLKNVICKMNNLLFKDKFVSSFLETIDDTLIRIANCPCKMNDIIEKKDNTFIKVLKMDLENKKYIIDTELKEALLSFKQSFCVPNISFLEKNLSLIKNKLNIIQKNIKRKKEDVFKTNIVVNALISLGITIIII